MQRLFRLPPAVTRAVRVHRNLAVPTRDGVVLRTDHWEPRLPGVPTILVRTPYGRGGVVGLFSGRLLAERGFHVVVQSCRGTFDSGGEWDPLRYEREDGLDTVAWIERQPWFDGNLFTYGPSYLGFTQWAIAAEAGPALKGMLTAVTTAAFRDPTYAGGAYSLDTILNWATLTSNQGGSMLSFAYKQHRAQRRLRRAWAHLPLSEVDGLATGREVAFFQDWLTHCDPGDPYWTPRGNADVARVQAPVCMVGGWYDIFLPWQLRDYATLRAAGAAPRLVIGDWTHSDPGLLGASMREGISWFRAAMNGGTGGGVRVHVGGVDEWRELSAWPPHARTTAWFLHPDGGLAPTPPPPGGEPDRFRYDPSDPTPSPGGALLTREAGRRDNRAVEARPDTVVYTSEECSADVEAIGPVSATIRVRADGEYFDVFIRVCDVDPGGRSENLSDGLVRVCPGMFPPDEDGVRAVEVELWPMGYVFRRGHRIRVQLAGGAHPRYARNCGTGEPLGSATELRPVTQEIWHDEARPSQLRLPI
ncbi:MAG TPA: CocE/NonD family hydrolase [Rugosimonospora sp.]